MSTIPLPSSSDSDNEVYGSLNAITNNLVDLTLDDTENEGDTDTSTIVDEEEEVLSDIDSEEEKKEEEVIEEKTNEDNSKECQTEEFSCGICYKELYVGISVSTTCNHHYCKTCFFRWIEVNSTCPQCRAPIDSKTNLTDQQIQKELSDIYQGYQHYLIENCRLFREQKRLCDQIFKARDNFDKLKYSTDSLLRRQISLQQQVELTRGYNEGQMAAIHNIKNKLTKDEYTSCLFEIMKNNSYFMRGFYSGLSNEETRLNCFSKKFLDILFNEMLRIENSNNRQDVVQDD